MKSVLKEIGRNMASDWTLTLLVFLVAIMCDIEIIVLSFMICDVVFGYAVNLWIVALLGAPVSMTVVCLAFEISLNPKFWVMHYRENKVDVSHLVFSPSYSEYILTQQKMKEWCENHCKSLYEYDAVNYEYIFLRSDDAVAFKLVWA